MNLQGSIHQLNKTKKVSKTLEKLEAAGIATLEDLFWIMPLRISPKPRLQDFSKIHEDEMFLGSGKVITKKFMPAFGKKGKGRMQLFQISLLVKDHLSEQVITLRWFNAYPNQVSSLKKMEELVFWGKPQLFQMNYQIVNPKLGSPDLEDTQDYLVEYPTIGGVPGKTVLKYLETLPSELWNQLQNSPLFSRTVEDEMTLSMAIKIIHGKIPIAQWSRELENRAKHRLIKEEIYRDQLKIFARKLSQKKLPGHSFIFNSKEWENAHHPLPFTLTDDQIKTMQAIREDLHSGHPMMRMIQGDVGCGKTSMALISAYLLMAQGCQVALLAPTESLAQQHFLSAQQFFEKTTFPISLLTGSTKAKERKIISDKLSTASGQIIIGTHALFQKDVHFSNLGLVIIDEQHKFGVDQRLKMLAKGDHPHCLIMTATPIPRTLRLTQYGDLDISLIKTMPAGRRGTKTRIVTKETYEKFLSFLKTRLDLGEQAYIVVPAIEESETLAIQNIEQLKNFYKEVFSNYTIEILHGQLDSEEKKLVLQKFNHHQAQILLSTSVVEVGINVPNATIMAIYNPERFGLSSLHQLRGRVGRGHLPGFCFLVPEDKLSQEGLERLQIIENSTDGFVIAEEDLKRRGHGDLFGNLQSGANAETKLSNPLNHAQLIEQIHHDLATALRDSPETYLPLIASIQQHQIVTQTI